MVDAKAVLDLGCHSFLNPPVVVLKVRWLLVRMSIASFLTLLLSLSDNPAMNLLYLQKRRQLMIA